MRSVHVLKKGLGIAAVAAAAMVGLLPYGATALPFSYSPGDVLAVINKAGTDLIVNFGALPATTTTKSFDLPTQFGGSLAGATFSGAFRLLDKDAFPESIEFTTTSPLKFPDPNGDFVNFFTAAQPSFNEWVGLLPNIPASGTGIFSVDPTRLVLDASLQFSYTGKLGLGTDAINSALTSGVTTRSLFGAATTTSMPFYTVSYDFDNEGNSIYFKNLLGSFTAAQNGTQVDLTFATVPEPGTLLLLMSGLVGLAVSGRRSRA